MPVTTSVVFVIDDDVSVREALDLLIGYEGWTPKIFGSAREFLTHSNTTVPHCLILDVDMPDLTGLDLQKLLADDRPEMPIIFITGYGNVPMTVQAMKAGAIEFFTKPFDQELLLTAIRHALEISAAALDQKEGLRELRKDYASLSPREREVMEFVITGLMNKQVGFELGISEITVKAHRGRMMQKMKARSFADLVKMGAKL